MGWVIASRGQTYQSMKRYEEALADFDRAIVLDEKSDWKRYARALVYLVTGRSDAFKSDLQTAIELAQAAINETPDDWRLKFNHALYLLVGRDANAEVLYDQLMSVCQLLPRLQAAIEDLNEFLIIQPSNKQAQLILARLQARISEIKESCPG